MIRRAATVAAAAAIAATLNMGAANAAPDNLADGVPHCASEDSGRQCTWNVGYPLDGNGHGTAFYRDRHGDVHRAADCFTILRSASYEFPAKARSAYRICLRNSGSLHLVRRGSDSDMAQAEQRTHRHEWYVGRYAGQHGVWAVTGATGTTVFIRRGWFTTS